MIFIYKKGGMMMKVKDCMCTEVYCVTPEKTIKDCATIMCNQHVGCIPVCDNSQKVVGLVTDRDVILRAIACNKDVNTTPVSEIMTCEVCCCEPDTEISQAESLMAQNQIKRIPVMENNKIVGILTLGDLAANKQVDDKGVEQTLNHICGCKEKNAQ